jgi:hypothetical protein
MVKDDYKYAIQSRSCREVTSLKSQLETEILRSDLKSPSREAWFEFIPEQAILLGKSLRREDLGGLYK